MKLSRTRSLALLLAVVTPLPALAAANTLQSQSFIMDDVNFATNTVLSSTQDGVPPIILSQGPRVTKLTPTTVTIAWETDKKSTSKVNYGITAQYGTIAGTEETVTEHSVTISGLKEETTYHYQVVSEDSYGFSGKSTDYTFKTPAQTAFREISITQVTYTTALVTVVTGGLTSLSLQYGTALNTGEIRQFTSTDGTNEQTVSLTDLTPGTKYFLKLSGTDSSGSSAVVNGLSFTTIAMPASTNVSLTPVSPNELVLKLDTNTLSTVTALYRSENDEEDLSVGDTTLSLTHELHLIKLFGNTEYTVTPTIVDAGGQRLTLEPLKASTLTDGEPPIAEDPSITTTKAGSQINVTARWDANEPVISEVSVISKLTGKEVAHSKGSDKYAVTQVVAVSGLAPKTPYILKAVSKDAAGNVSEKSINFVTPSIHKSILELIGDTLSKLIDPISRLFAE